MHVLPALVPGRVDILPLVGPTAEGLAAALAGADNAATQRTHLRELLEQDPVLALWTLCRAARDNAHPLLTCADLAGWLAANLPAALAWQQPATDNAADAPATLPTGGRDRNGSPRQPSRQLATQSFAVSRLAANIAEHAGTNRDEALLLGLLHDAEQWLTAAATSGPLQRSGATGVSPVLTLPGDAETVATNDCLPPWLVARLQEIAACTGPDASTAAGCVAAAVRLVAAGKRAAGKPVGRAKSPAGFKFNRRQHDREIAALVRRWSRPSASAAWLPALAARLQRLAALEVDFSRRLETEKLDALKELAYGAGHEINNPLANISARAQTLLTQERDPERRRLLAAINTQAFRAHEMIADMMLFARPPEPELAAVDLAELIASIAKELGPQAAEQHTELVCRTPAVLHARVDSTQVRVAIRALCSNALEALGEGGRVELAASAGEPSPAADSRTLPAEPDSAPANSRAAVETVQITVADNGPGISPTVRQHIFDPFYSGREAGRGLGFGLSKCWRIVQMHGGQIDVESRPGAGACFTVRLPAHRSE
ncbi:MAG: sensor histidine kinase [Pirellulales bacterium]